MASRTLAFLVGVVLMAGSAFAGSDPQAPTNGQTPAQSAPQARNPSAKQTPKVLIERPRTSTSGLMAGVGGASSSGATLGHG